MISEPARRQPSPSLGELCETADALMAAVRAHLTSLARNPDPDEQATDRRAAHEPPRHGT